MKVLGGFVLVGVLLLGAGMGWWWGFGSGDGEPEASAQEKVQNACDNIEKAVSYDLVADITGADNGVKWGYTATMKAEISGKDYRVVISASDGAADKYIKVGGVGYTRSTFDGTNWRDWEEAKAGLRDIDSDLAGLGDTPICPKTENLTLVGEETLYGSSVTHYTEIGAPDGASTFDDVPADFRGIKRVNNHDFWVIDSGQLGPVHTKQLEFDTIQVWKLQKLSTNA